MELLFNTFVSLRNLMYFTESYCYLKIFAIFLETSVIILNIERKYFKKVLHAIFYLYLISKSTGTHFNITF